MGAPTGNRNAAKAKEWRDTIKYALDNYESSRVERGQALRGIATKLIEQALEGDHAAIKEIGERLDGKASQPISGDEENPLNVISSIIVEHVKSTHSDS